MKLLRPIVINLCGSLVIFCAYGLLEFPTWLYFLLVLIWSLEIAPRWFFYGKIVVVYYRGEQIGPIFERRRDAFRWIIENSYIREGESVELNTISSKTRFTSELKRAFEIQFNRIKRG